MPGQSERPEPTYLGDGAYAEFSPIDVCGLCVYAHNGVERTDEVFVGPTEFEVLIRYAKASPAFADAIRRAMA